MIRKSRFSNPTVLSPDVCPVPLAGFIQRLPFVNLATQVFGSEAVAVEWMCTPARALGYRRPIDVVSTNPQLVEKVLLRLENEPNM